MLHTTSTDIPSITSSPFTDTQVSPPPHVLCHLDLVRQVGESTEDREDGVGDDHDSKDRDAEGRNGRARDGEDEVRDDKDQEGGYHEGPGHHGQFHHKLSTTTTFSQSIHAKDNVNFLVLYFNEVLQ
ncbi:unnamed protein product [Cuscuta campestris]|uniref:Uncharacterized protein n=1 Tax=Cuscuta campestris TaxID=132261 RepID=A0A484MMR2_9ASTE|nr:unnamed protein product [Cuscuta campestris]